MAIQHWSDEIIIVDLSDEPEMSAELKSLSDFLAEKENYNVVLDCAGVCEITPANLSKLLKLHQLTAQVGRRLVFCNIEPSAEDVLSVTGLADVFDLTDDKFAALATLEMIG